MLYTVTNREFGNEISGQWCCARVKRRRENEAVVQLCTYTVALLLQSFAHAALSHEVINNSAESSWLCTRCFNLLNKYVKVSNFFITPAIYSQEILFINQCLKRFMKSCRLPLHQVTYIGSIWVSANNDKIRHVVFAILPSMF